MPLSLHKPFLSWINSAVFVMLLGLLALCFRSITYYRVWWEGSCEVRLLVGACMSRPILTVAKMWLCVFLAHVSFPLCMFFYVCFFVFFVFFFRTQEERVREEDQQTITVEVELKRHDSEPTISIPQPSPETRYTITNWSQVMQLPNSVITPTIYGPTCHVVINVIVM